MTESFQVGFTGDFLVDGQLVYCDIGLDILDEAHHPYLFLDLHEMVASGDQVEDLDVLICLTPQITRASLAKEGRLLGILRFGVGTTRSMLTPAPKQMWPFLSHEGQSVTRSPNQFWDGCWH